jgi:Family of unknown function (DUF5335)
MSSDTQRAEWARSLREFCQRNWSRSTRLAVVDMDGRRELASGLPLNGIVIGVDADGTSRVEIMLGGHTSKDARHLVRTIHRVRVVRSTSPANCCDSLEIEDLDGARTIVGFGSLTELGGS